MSAALLPGATVGVMGGGQLGRMLGQAARRLGYGFVVWSDEPAVPAVAVADRLVRAPYDDADAARAFAEAVDVVTLEFENVPAETAHMLEQWRPVRPRPEVLWVAQHRGREKEFLRSHGLPHVDYRNVADALALRPALDALGYPAVLKSAGSGYDGKGQLRLGARSDLAQGERLAASGPCVLERFVPLALEVSVLVARAVDGTALTYPVFENAHEKHVLDVSVVPARIDEALAAHASQLALRVAEALDLVGVACVECFVDDTGELLVNEIAPRPHNSAHLSIEACETDQFEQQLRAVCGLPLGATKLRSPAAMANLLGDLWSDGEPDWSAALEVPGLHLHLYGKREARSGRKMGHMTMLAADVDEAEAAVRAARVALTPPPSAPAGG